MMSDILSMMTPEGHLRGGRGQEGPRQAGHQAPRHQEGLVKKAIKRRAVKKAVVKKAVKRRAVKKAVVKKAVKRRVVKKAGQEGRQAPRRQEGRRQAKAVKKAPSSRPSSRRRSSVAPSRRRSSAAPSRRPSSRRPSSVASSRRPSPRRRSSAAPPRRRSSSLSPLSSVADVRRNLRRRATRCVARLRCIDGHCGNTAAAFPSKPRCASRPPTAPVAQVRQSCNQRASEVVDVTRRDLREYSPLEHDAQGIVHAPAIDWLLRPQRRREDIPTRFSRGFQLLRHGDGPWCEMHKVCLPALVLLAGIFQSPPSIVSRTRPTSRL